MINSALLLMPHYTCEDRSFSCPKSSDYCGFAPYDTCDCGADEYNENARQVINEWAEELATVKLQRGEFLNQLEGAQWALQIAKTELAKALEQRDRLAHLLKEWREYDGVDIPESHCNCLYYPPCNDCVEWGYLRELSEDIRKVLTEVENK